MAPDTVEQHYGLEYKDFVMPDTVEKTAVCASSGKLPLSSCPQVTEYVATDSGQRCDGKHEGYYMPSTNTHSDSSAEDESEDESTDNEPVTPDPENPNSGNPNGNNGSGNGNNGSESGTGNENGNGEDHGGGETSPPDQGDGSITPEE